MLTLAGPVRDAWGTWLSLTRDRCHIHYRLEGSDLAEHIEVCFASARATAERIGRDVPDVVPKRILEIGCSVGFNCFALARHYGRARLVGLEPDVEAVMVGRAMARHGMGDVAFVIATGERLPFPDGAFDLIVCHTVIEHVEDVGDVMSEMARVLAPGGAIHLEAPNYRWPREPHLGVWCLPCLGKRTMRALARLQGQGRFVGYLDHLQMVTPRRLERLFDRHALVWENRVRTKLGMIADGDTAVVRAYRTLARILRMAGHLGLARPILAAAVALGMYPSLSYTAAHRARRDAP